MNAGHRGDSPDEADRGAAGPIRVLFVCTGNSARSQMAEALLRAIGGSRFEVTSAGTKPSRVNPLTVQVLAERGIDASSARSKSIDDFVDGAFDWVVTVCDDARESCPYIPDARRMDHWSLEDPAAATGTEGERLAVFRRIRNEIEARVTGFAGATRAGAIEADEAEVAQAQQVGGSATMANKP